MSDSDVPLYLKPVPPGVRTYGRIRRGSDSWFIQADAQVTELAKRLFANSRSEAPGCAVFPATKRTIGDLNWLMQRYPLQIENEEAYAQELTEATAHAIRRKELNSKPYECAIPPTFQKELLPYQKTGTAFLVENRKTLLADEAGIGKTPQALAFLLAGGSNTFPALAVTPPHLNLQWREEINKFLGPMNVHIFKGMRPYLVPKADIYIIHYLLLAAWREVLEAIKPPTVIFDEIQDLRHPNTAKYSAASNISQGAQNVIGLSGTPIYNRGAEIWSVLNIIEYHCLGDRDSFTKEYCITYGSDVVTHPEVLSAHLKEEGLFLRRTKEDVLPELPPKRRIVQEIGMDDALYGELITGAVEAAVRASKTSSPLEKGRLMREAVEESRQACGVAKAPLVADFVELLLEAEEPVLLFAHHHRVFDEYIRRLKKFNPVEISGRATSAEKIAARDIFMSGATNLAIISMRAATGLNLQRARAVVFGELDWSPAVHSQCEDRACRLGQKDSVLAYYLVAPEGSDREIQDHLGLKVSQFVGLMGDRVHDEKDDVIAIESAKDHMKRLTERLRNRAKTVSNVRHTASNVIPFPMKKLAPRY